MALIAAAGGAVLDAEGRDIVLAGNTSARVSGVFAGSPEAARRLARYSWAELESEPKRPQRVALQFPRKVDPQRLARAQGSLLGQVIGDSLGSLVEFKSAREIAQAYPQGVRSLADGGVFHTIAGQPTDDSEMALTLARCLAREARHDAEKVLDCYRDWLTTRPIDIGATTERGLLGLHTTESESNGSLMRVSPIGIWAAGDPARAAEAARKDSVLTHPNPVCLTACGAYAAAIAAGVAGADKRAMLEVAVAHASGPALDAIQRGAGGAAPADFAAKMGWVLIALQNAFYCLTKFDFEESLVRTIGCGGDTDTNAAITGALLGAALGREAIPSRWILPVLACRPLPEAGAPRPRPMELWPDDVLELAEALLKSGSEP